MSDHTEVFDCPRCQIGHCRLEQMTYARLYKNMLLVLPNTQVFVCDVCGYREYEADALRQIQSVEFHDLTEKRPHPIAKSPAPEHDLLEMPDINPNRRPKS